MKPFRQMTAALAIDCPLCAAEPQRKCHSLTIPGKPRLRRMHRERYVAARTNTNTNREGV